MAIKNILVAYDGSDGAQAALRLGLRMAEKYDAHLTGLLPHGHPPAQMQPLLARFSELREMVARNETELMEEAEAKFRAQVGDRARTHWMTREADGDMAVVECARYHDITLVGQHDDLLESTAFAMHPDRIALQSGRPLLVVPKAYDRALGDRAAVAWDGQRAAARALADAMQILETKALVQILTVSRGDAPGPAERLEEHLARHGVRTEVLRLAPVRGGVGETILGWCRENAPELLVMGAYEHSKFREDLIGGVTNSVLKAPPCPVLLAH